MLNVTSDMWTKKIHQYTTDSNALNLMQYVALTLGALVSLALIFCLCCFCMKLSDLKMRSYIMELAKRRGVKVDLDQINRKRDCQSPLANENCAIFVPEVGIIL